MDLVSHSGCTPAPYKPFIGFPDFSLDLFCVTNKHSLFKNLLLSHHLKKEATDFHRKRLRTNKAESPRKHAIALLIPATHTGQP